MQAGSSGTTSTGHTPAIRANKVIGTKVVNRAGESIGEVKDIVLDKLSNNIMFAIVSFGGFLGIAEKYHPIPWAALDYDEHAQAYVVGLTREELQAAPYDTLEALTRDRDIKYRTQAFDYYKVPRYWS